MEKSATEKKNAFEIEGLVELTSAELTGTNGGMFGWARDAVVGYFGAWGPLSIR